MKKGLLIIVLIGVFINSKAQTVTDIDGNVYNSVTIGTQKWLNKNLNVTHYNNGDIIPLCTDSASQVIHAGAYFNYNNDTSIATIYGILYNWVAVKDSRKVCPTGFHIPDTIELGLLVTTLGGYTYGGDLKETGTTHWMAPNTGATNTTGFTALPSGGAMPYGFFSSLNRTAYWWSSTISPDTAQAWVWSVHYSYSDIGYDMASKLDGFAVRCISDSSFNYIKKIKSGSNIILSPNPFSTTTQITLSQTYHHISLSVYDIQGKLVSQNQYKDADKIQLTRKGLNNGMYFLKLVLDDKDVATGKVVVSD